MYIFYYRHQALYLLWTFEKYIAAILLYTTIKQFAIDNSLMLTRQLFNNIPILLNITKNTLLPSSFDPLSLALSILILFYLYFLFIKKKLDPLTLAVSILIIF